MEAEMADTDEAFGQDVQEKALDELDGGDSHDLSDTAIAVILVRESDQAVFEGDDAMVTDGDAEDVAAEVIEQFIDATHGALDVDFPGLKFGLIEQSDRIQATIGFDQLTSLPQIPQAMAELGTEIGR